MSDATKDIKATFQHELERLGALRDELKVQLALAKAEAQQEWDKLETHWTSVQDEIKRAGEQTKEPASKISAAAHQLVDELKTGYERIRAQIKTSSK